MSNMEYVERAQKLLDGDITPEEFVNYYNEKVEEENPDEVCGYNPHEHI